MKKTLILLFLILGILSISQKIKAEDVCYCYIHVDFLKGCYEWDKSLYAQGVPPCPKGGNDCDIRFCQSSIQGTVIEYENGYLITAQLPDYELTYSETDTIPAPVVNFPGANFTFGAGLSLHISECDPYPGLEGLNINLYGITTNSRGYFSVWVP